MYAGPTDRHAYRAVIPPVSDQAPRPLWSVMIPTYNCAGYLRETLTSVLAQDPGPEVMQIEVVDDHSTEDDPAVVVEELAGGRVSFYRHPKNVGHVRNFEACLRRSRGRLVHLLHGDDYVRDGFYRRLQHGFDEKPPIGAAFCRHIYMDEHGHWHSISPLELPEPGVLGDWLTKIAAGQRLAAPSIVVRREVYEQLGGFDCRMTCAGEDWEMWVRIAANYPVWFEPEPLAAYRMKRAGSLTGEAAGTLRLVRDMQRATDIVASYLPDYLPAARAHVLARHARDTYAGWALEPIGPLLSKGDLAGVGAHVRQALRCGRSVRTARSVASRLLLEGLRYAARRAGPRAIRRTLRKVWPGGRMRQSQV